MYVWRTAAATIAACVLGAGASVAQGLGVTGGAHVNPDQIQGGAVFELPPLAERLYLRPSASVGIGNGATLLAANGDLVYELDAFRRSAWRPYIGGGPAINHYRLDLYSESEAGLSMLGGFRHVGGLFSEFRVGFFSGPEVAAALGYSFGAKRAGRPARGSGRAAKPAGRSGAKPGAASGGRGPAPRR